MSKYRRSSGLFFSALVVLSSSVFLFPATSYALDTPRPLRESERLIQEQREVVEKKATILQFTAEEIQSLEDKKQTLAQQLESEKQVIEDLKRQIAEKKAAAEAEKKRVAELKTMFVNVVRYAGNSAGNGYVPGNCTWYVKDRRPDLPNNLGNANAWYSNAAAMGYSVGSAPKKGAVAATTAGGYGHVAYVEGVSADGQYVTVSEMNYGGLYSMNTRTVHYSTFNYIYEL